MTRGFDPDPRRAFARAQPTIRRDWSPPSSDDGSTQALRALAELQRMAPQYTAPAGRYLDHAAEIISGCIAALYDAPESWRRERRPGNHYGSAGEIRAGWVCIMPGQQGTMLDEPDIPAVWAEIPIALVGWCRTHEGV